MTLLEERWPFKSTRWSRAAFATLVLALVLGAAGVLPVAQAQSLKVLHSFSGSDGQNPVTGLVRDAAGNLYGITPYGGIYGNCDVEFGGGTVFKLNPAGRLTRLHAFNNVGDGCGPTSLILDPAGNLYGTTSGNTVFKIDATGKFSVIYTFRTPSGGSFPNGLMRDVQGNLYGTTGSGGAGGCFGGIGCGTVFELNTRGEESVLYSFTGSPDGNEPQSGLTRDAGGNFYGTTSIGGDVGCPNGCGIVFSVNKPGIETVVYRFTGGADGGTPWTGGLVRDSTGYIYGTTSAGGDLSCNNGFGCGVAFKVDGGGRETVLHAFTGADGSVPTAGLIRDAAGNLYGTTEAGGQFGSGTVFKLDSNNNLTVLHNFNNSDGALPWAGLIRDAAGNLYGTTQSGGRYGSGTVFEITP